jgi:cytochrome c oxidase assembly protein subunit 15
MRVIALCGVIAAAGSIITGAAVRLSDSGLGCPDWPECTRRSLVAAGSADSNLVHAWVEFGNRLFATLVTIVAAVVLVAAWRFARGYRRPGRGAAGGGTAGPQQVPPLEGSLGPAGAARQEEAMTAGGPSGPQREPLAGHGLIWLAAAQPAGVVLQAVLGGIVVLTKLDPVTVSIHFLASIALLGAAVALYAQFTDVARRDTAARTDLVWLSVGLVAVTGLMLAAGTVVTGTGPLAGAASVPRYNLPLQGVTQFHADIGWLLFGLTVATVIALRSASAPPAAVRLGWLLLGLILVQGIIGYAQYFSGLPAGLVWVHVFGATLIWIVALRLFFVLHPLRLLRPARSATPAQLIR